jgi:hypothetical protein
LSPEWTPANLIESDRLLDQEQGRRRVHEGEIHMKIQRRFRSIAASLGVGLLMLAPSLRAQSGQASSPLIGYEVVGQVLNPSAQQSQQYGYLNFVRGLDRITTSAGAAVSESTALFTFFSDTLTERVINNGPMRVVDRTGTGAIYLGPGDATFANPDTFRVGTPVQTFSLRHQVVIDTSSGYFTTTFEITITSVQTFEIDGKPHRLGHQGRIYRLNVSGKLAAPAPPSAYIAGAADGGGGDIIEND